MITLRVSAPPGAELTAALETVRAAFTVEQVRGPYPNRHEPGSRVYVTAAGVRTTAEQTETYR